MFTVSEKALTFHISALEWPIKMGGGPFGFLLQALSHISFKNLDLRYSLSLLSLKGQQSTFKQ